MKVIQDPPPLPTPPPAKFSITDLTKREMEYLLHLLSCATLNQFCQFLGDMNCSDFRGALLEKLRDALFTTK
jgi:hypothetical protein